MVIEIRISKSFGVIYHVKFNYGLFEIFYNSKTTLIISVYNQIRVSETRILIPVFDKVSKKTLFFFCQQFIEKFGSI